MRWKYLPDSEIARAIAKSNAENLVVYEQTARLRQDYVIERLAVESAYSRRQVVELIQNGADAITEANLKGNLKSGRVEVVLSGNCLYCANEGSPLALHRDGYLGLQYSNISDKPQEAIGRFGLGFKSILALSDHPFIFSDSASISFSPNITRKALTKLDNPEVKRALEDGKFPLLRFAQVVDPEFLTAKGMFAALEEFQWASTVVALPLKAGAEDWLVDSLRSDEFPGEFMIFAKHVGSVLLRCPDFGFERLLLRTEDDDGTIGVLDGEKKSTWMVSEWVHELSKDAQDDFGDESRTSVVIAWARPREVVVQNGEVWSFFPVRESRTIVPGIVNSGWKLNSDRSSVLDGPMNIELFQSFGTKIAAEFPHFANAEDPGVVLDYLPFQASNATDPSLHKVLRSSIWNGLEGGPAVPDLDGIFRSAAAVRGWPISIVRLRSFELQNDWSRRSYSRAWPHASAGTALGRQRDRQDRRLRILKDLGVTDGSVAEWLECLVRSHDPTPREAVDDSRNALEIAMRCANSFIEAGDSQALESLATARIARTMAGTFGSIGDSRIHPSATDASFRPHPELLQLCTELQELIGLRRELRERDLIDAIRTSDWDRAWSLIHDVERTKALATLSSSRLLTLLPVKLVSGKYALSSRCFRMGGIVTSQSDPDFCVDPEFHQADELLLDALGVTTEPRLESFNYVQGQFSQLIQGFISRKMSAFRAHYARLYGGSGPQVGQLSYEPMDDRRNASFSSHLSIVDELSPDAQSNFVIWASSNKSVLSKWRISHSNSQKYPSLPVTSPTVAVLVDKAKVATSQGLMPVALAFPSQFAYFKEFVAVAERLRSDFLDNLAEPEREGLVRQRARIAISSAVDFAHGSEEAVASEFLADFARDGYVRPSEIKAGLALTHSLQQLRQRRRQDLATWLATERDIQTLSEHWEIQTLDAAELVLIGEESEVVLTEYVPSLNDQDFEDLEPSIFFVIEAEEIIVASEAVPSYRAQSRIYVSKSLDFEERIDSALRLAFPGQDDEWFASVSSQHFRQNQIELIEACKNSSNDAGRLQVLLAGELHSIAKQLRLPEPLAKGSEGDIAGALLTIFGTSVLKQVRFYSRNLANLPAPKQWAGGAATVDFVTRLGFSPLYAGTRSTDRPSYEESWGPVRIGDLHPFQEDIALQIQITIAEAGEALVDLPTGSGKTRIMIEATIRQHIAEGRPLRILWIAERQELCEQAVVSWRQLWRAKGREGELLRIHRLWGGNRLPEIQESSTNLGSWIIVASRQKLRSVVESAGRAPSELRKCTTLIVDEAHHAEAPSYRQIKEWRSDDPTPFTYLGLSATPFRSDEHRTGQLARLFGKSLIKGMAMGDDWKDRIRWLQSNEYLSNIELRDLDFRGTFGTVDLTEEETRVLTASDSQNLTRGIDLINERLSLDPARIRKVVQAIIDLDESWPVVVFAGSVSQAKVLAVELSRLGVPTRPIWGELDDDARRNAVDDFRAGRVRVLTNYNVLHEGFDAPMTRAVVISRFVGSDIAFLQMLGRGMRGPRNQGTRSCMLITTGERLESSFDGVGNLDIERFEYLWNPR